MLNKINLMDIDKPNFYINVSDVFTKELDMSYLKDIGIKLLFKSEPIRVFLRLLEGYCNDELVLTTAEIQALKSDINIFKSMGLWNVEKEKEILEELSPKRKFKEQLKLLPLHEQVKYYNKMREEMELICQI